PNEPDEPPNSPAALTEGVPTTGRLIRDATDVDYYQFTGVANKNYQIKVTNVGANISLVVELYDQAGTLLRTSNVNGGGLGNNVTINYRAVAGQSPYTIRIFNKSGQGGCTVGSFDYTLTLTGAAAAPTSTPTVTPTVTKTATPGGPTMTPTPTNTPIPTNTPCTQDPYEAAGDDDFSTTNELTPGGAAQTHDINGIAD